MGELLWRERHRLHYPGTKLTRRINSARHWIYKMVKRVEHLKNKLVEWWRKPTQGEHIEMLTKEVKTIRDQRDRLELQIQHQRGILELLRDQGIVKFDKRTQKWSPVIRSLSRDEIRGLHR